MITQNLNRLLFLVKSPLLTDKSPLLTDKSPLRTDKSPLTAFYHGKPMTARNYLSFCGPPECNGGPATGVGTCKPAEFYTIPEERSLVGLGMCLKSLQNVLCMQFGYQVQTCRCRKVRKTFCSHPQVQREMHVIRRTLLQTVGLLNLQSIELSINLLNPSPSDLSA